MSRYWNREESKYTRVEKVIKDYVFLDRASKDSVVKATLSLPTKSIIHLFHSLSVSIKPDSSTNQKLCSVVFQEEVYSRVYNDYPTQTEESKNLLQETFKHLQNELASPFLQSIIDRSDSSDNDRYQSCLTLLVINPVKSWERILNIPVVVKDIDSIQQDYLAFCNDAIQNYPPTLSSTIVMSHCSKQFFLSLLSHSDEKTIEIALLLISWFPWEGVEKNVTNCFIESTTPYPIRRLCVEALQRINSEASAKSLFELIQNTYAL